MLKADHIRKNFGTRIALDNVSLTLEPGHIFGLLGTNGAGKSTLLRILSGLYRPDHGKITLDDAPVLETSSSKRAICYLSDEPASISEMARLQASFYPDHSDDKLAELCLRFSLPLHERIASFSKGTQKRAQICLGLARNPRVLLCDETFDGLDPVMRESFKRVLSQETCDRGLITVLAGHNQQEMEDICDSVGFLHEGKLVRCGDLDSLLGDVQKVQFIPGESMDDSRLASFSPLRVQRQGQLIVLTVRSHRGELEQRLRDLKPLFLEFLPLSLEEIFILEMEDQGYAK